MSEQPLDGTDYAKVKFVGMAFDDLDRQIGIGDELVLSVRARCVGVGQEQMHDGVRRIVKMRTTSVVVSQHVPAANVPPDDDEDE